MVISRFFGILILLLAVPAITFAAGGHDGLNCTGCHGIHNAKGSLYLLLSQIRRQSARDKTDFFRNNCPLSWLP